MSVRLLLCICLLAHGALAGLTQEGGALRVSVTGQSSAIDDFGGDITIVHGEILNESESASTQITVSVEAFDADGQLIGEGFGFVVDACGTALLDFALMPGGSAPFSAQLDRFGVGEIASITAFAAAKTADATPTPPIDSPIVLPIARAEVVALRWLDDETLLYGIGCADAVFTELEWRRYSIADRSHETVPHPDAVHITPEMIERSGAAMITQSGEQKPELFYGSQMTFPPGARRIVYQNDLHSILSAEKDGSFKRLIHDGLHRHSLRGFNLARRAGIFLAYYFGAYGEPVHYFSGDVDGKMLMGRLETLPPSITVPGPAPDGLSAVVGLQVDGQDGYYLQYAYGGRELLFAADLPGNNTPAPIVSEERLIYVVRDVNGAPTLQCFNRETRALRTVTPLPLRLTRESRAWMALSPGGGRLALSANGVDGGVWWLDVSLGCG